MGYVTRAHDGIGLERYDSVSGLLVFGSNISMVDGSFTTGGRVVTKSSASGSALAGFLSSYNVMSGTPIQIGTTRLDVAEAGSIRYTAHVTDTAKANLTVSYYYANGTLFSILRQGVRAHRLFK